ncbi:MAG TPA: hypothetical protein VF701_04160 [Thermoanaerobaculia bacterium]
MWRVLLIAGYLVAASVASAQVETKIVVDAEKNVVKTKTELISELHALGVTDAAVQVNTAMAPFADYPIVGIEKVEPRLVVRTQQLVNRYLLLKLQVLEPGRKSEVAPLKSKTLYSGRQYVLKYGNTCMATKAGTGVIVAMVIPYTPTVCKFVVGCMVVGTPNLAYRTAQKMGTGCDNAPVLH